ncbi:pyridoxamine 5'-phosphate oxidase family protein [Nioella nitratireducens]|uniref:pyridoxamine 5'-phosphate oxidase family protein n=1 Tax=Nioella nitratireducens TaxID=1287720 RepID=UPI0008FD3E29|nr:pyridoxamine 5'-phosphate oxidase family protein [Nioella nitratireducens]
MKLIEDIAALEEIYDRAPAPAAMRKVAGQMTPHYRKWIMSARFCILSTVGPEGTDASPRGDDGPAVLELDPSHLAMPDWRGNNRIDSLRNIVRDGRVSLMFMVPGSANVVRVNGRAVLTDDPDIVARFERKGQHPRSVIVVEIAEIYSQCARAILRADLWNGRDESGGLPTIGDILTEMTEGEFDGKSYDADWPQRARDSLW